jgi:hypothetical protein
MPANKIAVVPANGWMTESATYSRASRAWKTRNITTIEAILKDVSSAGDLQDELPVLVTPGDGPPKPAEAPVHSRHAPRPAA